MHKNFGNPWSHFPEKHRFVSFLAILGHFGTVWPKIRKTGFFGRNPAVSLFTPYSALTSCKKSEKSLEPFSSNMGITLLLGPFWAIRPLKYHISAHFGKTRFFPGKRPCTFLVLIVVNLIAEYEENPWSGFWEISVTNQPTTLSVLIFAGINFRGNLFSRMRPFFWRLFVD